MERVVKQSGVELMSLRTYVTDLKRAFGSTVAAEQSGWVNYGTYGDDEWANDVTPEDYLRLSPAVYMATRYRSQKLASIPLQFHKVSKGGKKTQVTSGSLIELMTKVNPYWTFPRLAEMTEMSLCLRGKNYWALDRGTNSRGEPKEIWWMHPDKVKVVRGKDYISHFEYDQGAGRPLQFAKEEIFWLHYPNPANEFDGLAPLDAARIIADTGSAAMKSNARMFSQGMQLAGFVSPADRQDSWTKEQGEAIEGSLQRRFSGAQKAHRWAVLGRQMSFQALTLSPKDIEFIALLKWSFEDICRVFGLSPDLLGGDRTYANAAEARLAFWQDTMMPECSFFANEITEQILPLFPGQADLAEHDLSGVDVLQELEAAKWAREKEQIAAGALMLNEWREKKGLDPLHYGDDWWAPVGLTPVGGPMADAADQAAQDAADAALASAQAAAQVQPPPDPNALDAGQPVRALKAGPIRSAGALSDYGSPEHQRAFAEWVKRTEPHEQIVARVTADLMRNQRKSILAKLTNERGRRDVAEAVNEPFDMARWVKQFRQAIRPVFTTIVEDIGTLATDELGLGTAFDVKSPEALRFLTERAQRFAEEVNATTWTNLKASLNDGVDAGEGIDALAKRVEAVMGDRIRSSAETIARTEVIGAANGGTMLAWDQTGVVAGKEWLSAIDNMTRETHITAHGQKRWLHDDFEVGAGKGPHPGAIGLAGEDINCRCSMTAILDVDADTIPGKPGEPAPLPPAHPKAGTAPHTVLVKEDEIMGNATESAHAYDKDGKLLFRAEGDETTVSMSVANRDKLKDAIMTHNHPGSAYPGLSVADIKAATKFDLREIRAIESNGKRLSLKRPTKGWGVSPEEAQQVWDECERVARASYRKKIAAGLPMSAVNANAYIVVNRCVASKFGWSFTYD